MSRIWSLINKHPLPMCAILHCVFLAVLWGIGDLSGVAALGAVSVYFVIWWVVLFVTLPFGVQSQLEAQAQGGSIVAGTDLGAPVTPRFKQRILWTSLVAIPVYMAYTFALPFVWQ
jgi:predicted secreted protein